MCGIVGYLGPQNGVDIVLKGLELLEYRGYDSAGICFKNEKSELSLYKKAGAINNLKKVLEGNNHTSHLCIGHTRWATHGEVSDVNAHPHLDDCFAIVHNGIIENNSELKDELKAQGVKFVSDTDSEIFLRLVTLEHKKCNNFLKAVTNSFNKIKGNSAFFVINRDQDEIIALKRGAPLVCGTMTNSIEAFVSSDPYALTSKVDQLYFPEDEVICYLKYSSDQVLAFFELDGTETSRYTTKNQDIAVDVVDKGEFEHFMLKEIYEQPALIKGLINYYKSGIGREYIEKISFEKIRHIHILGCGTAWHAGLLVKNFIEQENRIPCSVELASEFRYRNPLVEKDDLGLFISQSGETADTLAAQSLCKDKLIPTISIVNVEGSTIFRDCDHNLLIKAGIEVGVASTKAFTLQALTGYLMSRGLSKKLDYDELTTQFELLANRIDALLTNADKIRHVAEEIYNYRGFIFTGRGGYFASALEGALKLKEIAYVHAEGYAAGELKHGPIALIDEKMVNIALIGPELYDKTLSNIEEVKARKGVIVVVGPENDPKLEAISDYYIPLNFEGLNGLAPLYVNVVNQLLSYYMAKFKGTDIDRPRNLAKSVTVE